jgi:hypothetical protein
VKYNSSFLLPSLYGIGTGLPVIIFAVLLTLGAGFVGSAFNLMSLFEKWARRITGGIFVLVGLYYVLIYLFGVPL